VFALPLLGSTQGSPQAIPYHPNGLFMLCKIHTKMDHHFYKLTLVFLPVLDDNLNIH
jgi:hypothetical protein